MIKGIKETTAPPRSMQRSLFSEKHTRYHTPLSVSLSYSTHSHNSVCGFCIKYLQAVILSLFPELLWHTFRRLQLSATCVLPHRYSTASRPATPPLVSPSRLGEKRTEGVAPRWYTSRRDSPAVSSCLTSVAGSWRDLKAIDKMGPGTVDQNKGTSWLKPKRCHAGFLNIYENTSVRGLTPDFTPDAAPLRYGCISSPSGNSERHQTSEVLR